ncbi:cytochrome P450 [Saccharopolyspora sp. HNM0983]|uniref:Cytochrome P450 n=1 Tax=Saccharopolyspora montiporae TaxID=2781240 RepID=A0A929G236_9PSEU|nr:cytochrome P450 [Saccharopolyspora sp. HNM0983]
MLASTSAIEDLPTAPGRLPGLGHAAALLRSRLRFLDSLHRCGPLVRVDLPGLRCWAVTSPELVHEIAADADSFGRGVSLAEEERVAGRRATAVHGRTRTAWSDPAASGWLDAVREAGADIARRWADAPRVDVLRAMDELVLSAIDRAVLAGRLGQRDTAEIHRLLPDIRRDAVLRTLLPEGLARLPTATHRRVARAGRDLQSLVDDVLCRAPARGSADPIAALTRGRARGGPADLRRDIVDTVFATTSGTAATLAWTLHELARRPELQDRLHRELDEVLDGGPATADVLDSLVRTRRILTEVLRLYAVPLVARRCRREVVLGGVRFPEGSELLCSPHAVHRDPEHYLRPDLFDPDRWLAGGAPVDGAFLPFGTGGQRCSGDQVVYRECLVALAALLARRRVVPAAGARVRTTAGGSVVPSGLRLAVLPR